MLGVNHIGHSDCKEIRKHYVQILLRQVAEQTDLEFSNLFGINRSAAITSCKPSGNSSVLFNCGPGINAEHEKYCLRNVTVNKYTAMYNFLYMNGVPNFEYKGAKERTLFSFPLSKENSIVIDDLTVLDQLNYWKQVKQNLMHHTASCSIIYEKDKHEDTINDWLSRNQHCVSGLSFFPKYDNSHPHLPIQKISKEEYEQYKINFPKLDWNKFSNYETGNDEQNIVAECVGGNCAI